MANLTYSDDALNVRNSFFGVKSIIYVEGDDDVLFWGHIFSKVTNEKFEIEPVGGALALDEYIERISDGRLQGIAARDADFLPLLNRSCQHPRVVYTFGYSIENSLYTATTLAQLVQSWCKSLKVTINECQEWLDDLGSKMTPLVHLDFANAISGGGISVMHGNCSCYMTNRHSATACSKKIHEAVQTKRTEIPSEAEREAAKKIGANPHETLRHLRGHFLASAVHKYIVQRATSLGKKTTISAESLYAAAIGQLSSALTTNHPHSQHYLVSAESAWQAL